MSEFIRGKRNFSVFDSLSTEELKEILRQDSQISSSENDVDAILYILEVLENREKNESDLDYEAKAALESFKENYLPFSDDPEPLYYDEEIINKDGEDVEVVPFKEKPEIYPKKKYHKLKTTKIVLIAAVIAIIVGSVSAQALGFDIWKRVAQWSKDTFGFASQTEQQQAPNMEHSIPPQLQEMADSMTQYGISVEELPTYIPKGYSLSSFTCDEGTTCTSFATTLESKGENNVLIIYTLYKDDCRNLDVGKSEFQKGNEDFEIIELSGDNYYVMSNSGKFFCVWYKEKLEGYICGFDSKDELLDILFSISGV